MNNNAIAINILAFGEDTRVWSSYMHANQPTSQSVSQSANRFNAVIVERFNGEKRSKHF